MTDWDEDFAALEEAEKWKREYKLHKQFQAGSFKLHVKEQVDRNKDTEKHSKPQNLTSHKKT